MVLLLLTSILLTTSGYPPRVAPKFEADHRPTADMNMSDNIQLAEAFLSMDNRRLLLNQPVVLKIHITNRSETPIQIDLGGNRCEEIEFTITFPDGTRRSLPKPIQNGMLGFKGSGLIKLDPNETFTKQIVVNEWISHLASGQYIIKASLGQVISREKAEPLQTSDLKFEINESNPERLKALSKRLLDEIIEYKSVDDIEVASRALCFISDPVALSYQEKALVSTIGVETFVIETLRQLGDAQSAEVLIYALSAKPLADWASNARWSLETIRSTTNDTNLKRRITEFLSRI